MEEGRLPRKRTPLTRKDREPLVADPLSYTSNKFSTNVRAIHSDVERVEWTIYFDKHYYTRLHLGDGAGERGGIGTKAVESLIRRCVGHLMYYSAVTKGFMFLNIVPEGKPKPLHQTRVVCREETTDGMLNVVIEAHSLSINKFEVTVTTAMCEEEFNISDGQYVIEMNCNNSTLFKMEKGKLGEQGSI